MLLLAALAHAEPSTAGAEDATPGAAFGTDVSVAVGAGSVLGAWPDAGVHGTLGGRVDLFMVDRHTPGPRFGASFWGRTALWPLQTHTGEGDPEPFGVTQYGVGAVLRFDPATRLTGTFGFGFGRTDIDHYEGGGQAVPTFFVEAGARQALGALYVDYGAYSGWGSARGTSGALEDWWTVGASVGVGLHAR